jgi:hypothetical protein
MWLIGNWLRDEESGGNSGSFFKAESKSGVLYGGLLLTEQARHSYEGASVFRREFTL